MKLVWTETDSPIGRLTLTASAEALCHAAFSPYAQSGEKLGTWARRWWPNAVWEADPDSRHPVLREAAAQLKDYFAGRLDRFDLPLDLQGTPFQREVWRALLDIPYGEVCSYRDVAHAIGKPLAVRAVGGANNRNPIPLFVPCHRVIGADGAMVGYGGGMPIKTHLLALERTREAQPAIAASGTSMVL